MGSLIGNLGRNRRNLEIWKSGNLEIWKSGNLEIWVRVKLISKQHIKEKVKLESKTGVRVKLNRNKIIKEDEWQD